MYIHNFRCLFQLFRFLLFFIRMNIEAYVNIAFTCTKNVFIAVTRQVKRKYTYIRTMAFNWFSNVHFVHSFLRFCFFCFALLSSVPINSCWLWKGHTQNMCTDAHRCTGQSVLLTYILPITCSHDLHFSLTLTFVACLFFCIENTCIFFFWMKQKFIIFYGSQFFISHKPKHTHTHTHVHTHYE